MAARKGRRPGAAAKAGWFCDFDDQKYDIRLSRIEHKLDRLLSLFTLERSAIMALQDSITAMQAAVTAQSDVVDSAKTLLEHLVAMINDLKSQVTDPAALAALDAMTTAIQANSSKLADAVAANTE